MPVRPDHLPDFDNPPVCEVVLGIQFAALSNLRTVHLGGLWKVFRTDFPNVAERPPIEPSFETFGGKPSDGQTINFSLRTMPPMPRLWFIDEDDVELIQFQPDRFIHNWRRREARPRYPHYEDLRTRYCASIEKLSEFLLSEGLGSLEPNQCEISYINQIPSESGEDLTASLGRILRGWIDGEAAGHRMPYEDARVQLRFPLAVSRDEPLGRLYVIGEPGVRPDGTKTVQLTFSAKGRPPTPTIDGALKFLDMGREHIVQSFAAMTTDEMHKRWSRTK